MLPIEQMYEDMQPLLLAGRPEDALQALRNTVRSFPDFARAHNDLGMLCYRFGDKPKALGHFERAAQIAPGNPVFLKNMADYYHVELGRVEDAVAVYTKILSLRPNEVTIRMTAAHLLVSLKRFADAAEHYRRVLDIEPWNAEANENLQKIQRILGGMTVRTGPEELYADAQRFAQSGDIEAARNRLEKLIGAHPEFAAAYNDLGVLYYQSGEKDRALKQYEEASRLQPGNPTFQKNLADFYWVEQGRTEDALRIYVRILESYPEDVETLTALGRISDSLSVREDARTFYERILEIEPWNHDALKALDELQAAPCGSAPAGAAAPQDLYAEATRLISGGDTASGRDRLLQLVAFHPDFATAHNDLGVLSYQAGDKQEALERCRKAARLEPSNMTFQKNLAEFYWIGFGRYEDALKIYVDLLTAYPEDMETLLSVGKLCQSLSRPEDARVFFERMLEIEPWNVEANKNLEQIQAAKAA